MDQKEVSYLPMIVSGGDEMVKGDIWHEIHSRHRLKETKKSIARSLDLDVRTVRKILHQETPVKYRRKAAAAGLLQPWTDYLNQRVAAVGYCAQSLYEELRDRGYEGGYDTVRRFVKPLRQEARIDATLRFETPPGRQGQADWGQCWTVLGGKRSRVHLFVMTLGYSRRLFARGTLDEKLPSFISCHIDAFDHFGGIPHEMIYDNPKTVVLSRNFAGSSIEWNGTFWDFATYYGFRPRPHRPYRAQTKGKVESGVKYVKRFLRGKVFESLDHLNDALMNWIATVADQRVHGTTHRKPAEMFGEEQDLLIKHHGKPPYKIEQRALRQVARDCMVNFETNRYSVPFQYAGKQVEVQCAGDLVLIYHNKALLVSHPRCAGSYLNCIDRTHFSGIYQQAAFHRDHPADDVQVRDLAFYEGLVEGGAL